MKIEKPWNNQMQFWQAREPFFKMEEAELFEKYRKEKKNNGDHGLLNAFPYFADIPIGISAMREHCYDFGELYERDVVYTKQLYPGVVKRIQTEVEDACDALDYENSMIYDAYPDKEGLRQVTVEIYKNLIHLPEIQKVLEKNKKNQEEEGLELLVFLIEILFYHELLHRREKRRRQYR